MWGGPRAAPLVGVFPPVASFCRTGGLQDKLSQLGYPGKGHISLLEM